MKFQRLIKPMPGIYFWVGFVFIHLNFAKTLTWEALHNQRSYKNTYYVSIHLVQRPKIVQGKIKALSALCFIFGPFKIMIGIARKP